MKFAVIAAAAALCATQTSAMPRYVSLIPGADNVPGVDAIGHVDAAGGGARNAFGTAFAQAKKTWSVDLCYQDSDSDGQFNGAELGDPCCEWVKGSNEKLAYTTASSPGDAASKQTPSVWASVKCANGQSPQDKYNAYKGIAPAPVPGPAPGPAPGPTPKPAGPTPAPGDKPTVTPVTPSAKPSPVDNSC